MAEGLFELAFGAVVEDAGAGICADGGYEEEVPAAAGMGEAGEVQAEVMVDCVEGGF